MYWCRSCKKIEFDWLWILQISCGWKARGLGLGKKLVQKCIDYVKEVNGKNLYLQSFHKLEIAVKMYIGMGFIDALAPHGMLVVERTEIIMKIK